MIRVSSKPTFKQIQISTFEESRSKHYRIDKFIVNVNSSEAIELFESVYLSRTKSFTMDEKDNAYVFKLFFGPIEVLVLSAPGVDKGSFIISS